MVAVIGLLGLRQFTEVALAVPAHRASPSADHCRRYRGNRRHDRRRAGLGWRCYMSPGAHTEHAFEDRVEEELRIQGWSPGGGTFDAGLGLDTGDMFQFIGATQVKKWERLIELYGGDQATAQRHFKQRVAAEVDARGVLDVLRQGVRD